MSANSFQMLARLLHDTFRDWVRCCETRYPDDGTPDAPGGATERANCQAEREQQWDVLITESFRRRQEFGVTLGEMSATVESATDAFNTVNRLPIRRLEASVLADSDTMGAEQYLRVLDQHSQCVVGAWIAEATRVQVLQACAALERIGLGAQSPTPNRKPSKPGTDDKKTKGKDINAKMLALLTGDLARYEWSAAEFAHRLGCGEGTVKETKAWKQVMKVRAVNAAERVSSTGALNGGRINRRA